MRIILSRKGFDSSSGGKPSPIFPDGRMVSLPIPDDQSPIKYTEVRLEGHDFGHLVHDLTKGKICPVDGAHLDPDLVEASLPREEGWRPVFGQTDAAQGHLRNNNVQAGDLFLFFGVFQRISNVSGGYKWNPMSKPQHVIWGWLQIEEILNVDSLSDSSYSWSRYHPHFYRGKESNNTLYVAKDKLNLSGFSEPFPGAGVFPYVSEELILTDPEGSLTTQWRLPDWMYPREGAVPLTYHSKESRWARADGSVRLDSVARGQEFVLDASVFPESVDWIKGLLGLC